MNPVTLCRKMIGVFLVESVTETNVFPCRYCLLLIAQSNELRAFCGFIGVDDGVSIGDQSHGQACRW